MLNLLQHDFAKPLHVAARYAAGMSNLYSIKEIRHRNLQRIVDAWKREHGHGAQRLLAHRLNMAPSQLGQYQGRRREIGDAVARRMEQELGLARNALDTLWTEDPEVPEDSGKNAFTEVLMLGQPPATYSASPAPEVDVPFHPSLRASAGRGITNGEPREPLFLKFRAESLRRRGIDSASAMVIYAAGDSMEPIISSGDTIMFDRSRTDLVDGRLYVIEIDGEALVKRLHRRPGNRVLVQSENPAYPAYEVAADTDGFRVLGQVVWGAGWLS